jgi:hypothetical protein
MSQSVSLARYTSEIETGKRSIAVAAGLGAAGNSDNAAELLMQPENANGEALGPPTELGPPTATDRDDETTQVDCRVETAVPVGTRSILVTLEATGIPGEPSTAMASSINVSSFFALAGVGPAEDPAQGRNCWVPGQLVTPSDPGTSPSPGASPPQDPPGSAHPGESSKAKLLRRKLAKVLAACKKVRAVKKRRACIRAAKARYAQRRFGAKAQVPFN